MSGNVDALAENPGAELGGSAIGPFFAAVARNWRAGGKISVGSRGMGRDGT
jgi:hypothetical protein